MRGRATSAAQAPAAKPANATLSSFPARRAGLWEQTLLRDGRPLGPAGQTRYCLDAASDAPFGMLGRQAGGGACQPPTVNRSADGAISFASTCNLGAAGMITTHGVVSGDFSASYTVRSQSEVTGSSLPAMNGRHEIDVTAHYLGPCPAGMTPGDVVMNGGLRGNINRLGHGAQ